MHLNDSMAGNNAEISLLNIGAQGNEQIKYERTAYLYAYAGIVAIGIVSFTLRSFSFYFMCLRISRNLHDMMFRGVVRAKMIFFSNNPSGRILNRFARDISNVDSMLPNVMFEITQVGYDLVKQFRIFVCE